MYKRFYFILSLFSIIFLFALLNNGQETPTITKAETINYKQGELLVMLKNGDYFKLKIPYNIDPQKFAQDLKNMDDVKFIVPDFLYKLNLVPNDLLLYKQWYLGKIHAYRAWNKSLGTKEVVVAVVDSGVDRGHPDLNEKMWVNQDEVFGDGIDNDNNGYIDDRFGWDFITDNNDPNPKIDQLLDTNQIDNISNKIGVIHGTAVAGIIGAQPNNYQGLSGIAWKVKIMPLRVADAYGYVDGFSVIKAIDYAVANNADIINLSFGGINNNPILEEVLLRAYKAGLIVVASAGNQDGSGQLDLDSNPLYPVCSLNNYKENILLGVAATTKDNKLASFSHYGSKCVDLVAPGVDFYVAQPKFSEIGYNKYYGGPFSGTSMAAPVVSGAAALLKSIHPNWTNKTIIRALLDTAKPVDNINPKFKGKLGKGLIDLLSAVSFNPNNIVSKRTSFLADDIFLFTSESKDNSRVNLMAADWSNSNAFDAFPFVFKGGIKAVLADINNDGEKEVIATPGFGGGPQVRIFKQNSRLISQFFAYDQNFRGGISIGIVDYNFDGINDIITVPGLGYKDSIIRIFDFKGHLINELKLNELKEEMNGFNIAIGDVDSDGNIEIVLASEKGSPKIYIYNLIGQKKYEFLAYPNNYQNGVKLALGDVNDDNNIEIITGTKQGGGPQIRIFKYDGTPLDQFFADDVRLRKGINIGVLKVDGKDRILVGSGINRIGFIRLVDIKGNFLRNPLILGNDFNFGIRFGLSY